MRPSSCVQTSLTKAFTEDGGGGGVWGGGGWVVGGWSVEIKIKA